MKKISLGTIILLISITSLFSQIPGVPGLPFHIGIKGHFNLSNFYGSDTITEDYKLNWKPGFNIGPYIDFNFGNVGIQGEILYSMRGCKAEWTDTVANTNNESEFTLSYIDIPILFKLNLPVPTMGVSFYAGGLFGIKVSESTKVIVDGTEQTTNSDEDIAESSDIGLVFGADLNFQGFIVDARYTLGLKKVIKEVNGYQSPYKNSMISLGIGYQFL